MKLNGKIKEFKTERLILRGVTHADIPSYQKYFADFDIIGPLAAGVPWPYPENGVQQFLDNVIFPDQGKDRCAFYVCESNEVCEPKIHRNRNLGTQEI